MSITQKLDVQHFAVSREDFELIRAKLDMHKKKTRPRRNDIYDVFNAILYRLKTNTPWRSLPECYPCWRSVHEYFTHWKGTAVKTGDLSLLESALTDLKLDEYIVAFELQEKKMVGCTYHLR